MREQITRSLEGRLNRRRRKQSERSTRDRATDTGDGEQRLIVWQGIGRSRKPPLPSARIAFRSLLADEQQSKQQVDSIYLRRSLADRDQRYRTILRMHLQVVILPDWEAYPVRHESFLRLRRPEPSHTSGRGA